MVRHTTPELSETQAFVAAAALAGLPPNADYNMYTHL